VPVHDHYILGLIIKSGGNFKFVGDGLLVYTFFGRQEVIAIAQLHESFFSLANSS
jgi:hypothetical protein